MQFKNPDILYALFLLLIPIIVHLFQLRRFKKTPFSNVSFLQAVVKNTRKSSKLKKWLILTTRLLALTAAILAFAQPFIPNSENATRKKETVIFIDNSYSMQAKGDKGPLLTEAIQDLIENAPSNFTLVTNDEVYKNLSITADQNKLLGISYSSQELDATAVNLKINNAFSEDNSLLKELILVSDFQSLDSSKLDSLPGISQHWVKMRPIPAQNINIDSLAITRSEDTYKLQVFVNQSSKNDQKIPVSLFNEDKLIAKATVSFDDVTTSQVSFTIPTNTRFLGRISINDAALTYDNNFYFSIENPDVLQVLSINNTADDDYLAKIFNTSGYNYKSVDVDKLSYNLIDDQQVIVLNELKTIPQSLINILLSFRDNGGQLILIPNGDTQPTEYAALLTSFGLPPFGEKNTAKSLITSINYEHPLYRDVFERRATNFQYPSISQNFQYNAGTPALTLDNGNVFLSKGNGIFVFSGSLNETNSNFQESPLIVPTFEEMAKTALSLPKTYYFLGKNNSFDLKTEAEGDAVYELRQGENVFIPLQEKKGKVVTLSTQEAIEKDGIYEIVYKDSITGHVAFNYNHRQSLPVSTTQSASTDISVSDSLRDALLDVAKASSLNQLFKWFLIFAVFFLFCEMLLLKFLK
jgi:hypothetical protein